MTIWILIITDLQENDTRNESEGQENVDDQIEKCEPIQKKLLTTRQKEIKCLEEMNNLSDFERIRLNNLKEQEVFWVKSNMDAAVNEAKISEKSPRTSKKKSDLDHKIEASDRLLRSAALTTSRQEIATNEDYDASIDSSDEEGDNISIQSSQKENKLSDDYPADYLEHLKQLPLRKDPLFVIVPGSVPFKKNSELGRLLHISEDSEKIFKLAKATPEEYMAITGKEPDDVRFVDTRRDNLDDLSGLVKSNSWMNQLAVVYKKISVFVDEYPEFR